MLDPNIKKGPWSEEDDEAVFSLYKKFGKSWSKIANNIIGRTENQIKNRFYSTIRKIAKEQKKDSNGRLIYEPQPKQFSGAPYTPNHLYKLILTEQEDPMIRKILDNLPARKP